MQGSLWKHGSLLATLGLFLGLAAGCGGGGGGGSAGGTVFPLATRLATLQPGNTWTYSVTGNGTVNGQAVTVSGTITISVAQATLNGQAVLAQTIAENFSLNNGGTFAQNTTTYYIQDPNTGDVKEVGDLPSGGNTARTLNSPLLVVPGSWSTASSYDNLGTFNTGDTIHRTFTIEGTQVVTTPSGTFTAWKVAVSQTANTGGTVAESNVTWWFAPEMGWLIQTSGTASSADGSTTLTITGSLTSTNLPVH
ncbi:MAG TPA: hypothetical protein VKU00_25655 [Chthonomonadaceae bacterium]|nr:hypothetical protein [Chthonomonadaceae bacterium]